MNKLTDVETELRKMIPRLRGPAPDAASVIELASDIVANSGRQQSAVHFIMNALKSHHIAKPGIAAIVRKAESMLNAG